MSASKASGRGAFRGREQHAVDAMFLHPRDKAGLAFRRFPGIGDEGDPARLIERIVDASREFRVERIGDLADDQPDRMGDARSEIGGGAVIDVAERVDRGLHSGPRRFGDQRAVAQNERNRRRRHTRVAGDVLHGRAHSTPPRGGF